MDLPKSGTRIVPKVPMLQLDQNGIVLLGHSGNSRLLIADPEFANFPCSPYHQENSWGLLRIADVEELHVHLEALKKWGSLRRAIIWPFIIKLN